MSYILQEFLRLIVLAYFVLAINCISALGQQSEENMDYSLLKNFEAINVELRSSKKYYCGLRAADKLTQLCKDVGYFSPGKRTSFYHPISDFSLKFFNERSSLPELIGDRYELNDRMYHKRGDVFQRNTRGLHDDCCAQPCTESTLRLYCNL